MPVNQFSQQMNSIMAGLAGVKVTKWWKFVVPVFLCLFVTQALLIILAVATGFGG